MKIAEADVELLRREMDEARARRLQPQMRAYADVLTRALGESVGSAVLIFLNPQIAHEEQLALA